MRFKFKQSKECHAEVVFIEKSDESNELVVSHPCFVFLPDYVGSIKVCGQRISSQKISDQKLEMASFYVPAYSPIVFDDSQLSGEATLVLLRKFEGEPLIDFPVWANMETFEAQSFLSYLANDREQNQDVDLNLWISRLVEISRFSRPLCDDLNLGIHHRAIKLCDFLKRSENFERSLTDFANELQVHMSQMSREFRRLYGINPHKYWVLLRLCISRWLLQNGETSMEVAHKMAFSDQSHFTRLFQAHFGQTPFEFQQHAVKAIRNE